MAEDTTTTVEETETTTVEEKDDNRVPYERFKAANEKAKEAASKTAALEKQLNDLSIKLQERDDAGLPELERERKAREKLEERLAEADKRAQDAEQRVQDSQRERWIVAAAQAQNFADPSDASAFLALGDIEDEKDAERAVKRLASQKKHLLKNDDPQLPGRVLKDGKAANDDRNVPGDRAEEEGRMLLDGINAITQQGFRPAGRL